MLNLNAGILAAVPRVVPPHSVIAALARAANQRQALVARRHTEIATLVNTRDALLPRLLSGDLSAAGGERVRTAKA